jgi:energy-coupling factor transport system substrate-specific component
MSGAAATLRGAGRSIDLGRPALVYLLTTVVGVAAFLWPFFVPAEALPSQAHGTDAPLVAAAVGALAVVAVTLELRSGRMNGATIALLGVLAATGGLLRLLNLPGGGSGVFFLVVLAGAAFGPRFGFLLGLMTMTVSAVITGGIGPWLPFQMLALGWMGAGAGLLGLMTRRLHRRLEVAALAAYGWVWGLVYGAILNLWFWPFVSGEGGIWYEPGLALTETVSRYLAFYALTSFAWDAAAALANLALIVITGGVLLRSMRRFAHRLDPVVMLEDPV